MELPRSLICAAGEAFKPLSCAVDGEAAATPPDRILRRRPEGCGDCPAGAPGPSPYSMTALWPPLENVIVVLAAKSRRERNDSVWEASSFVLTIVK